jgi:pyridoxamine 5'-phosphate oxidase
MAISLRQLVCLYFIRPSIGGAFLTTGSLTAKNYRIETLYFVAHFWTGKVSLMTLQSSNNNDLSSCSASIGQIDIGRQNVFQLPNPCADDTEDAGDENEATSLQACMDDADGTILSKSWRQYLEASIARSRKIRGSNYVQIATVDSKSNEPRCRTVVFRGFHNTKCDSNRFDSATSLIVDPTTNIPLSGIMKMCTDIRSEKVNQTGPSEMVWWFPKTSEQYRIRGEMILIGNDETNDRELIITRKEMWGSLTDSSRESFLTTQRPGDVYTKEVKDPNQLLCDGRDAEGKVIQPPPDTFLLMILIPKRCDYLNLTNMFRQVDTVINGKWQSQRVNA